MGYAFVDDNKFPTSLGEILAGTPGADECGWAGVVLAGGCVLPRNTLRKPGVLQQTESVGPNHEPAAHCMAH